MEYLKTAGYLAPEDFEKQLLSELKGVDGAYGRLYLSKKNQQSFWAQNIWQEPFIAHFDTIGQAAALLKGMQRNWAHYPFQEHRRAALIKEKLPYFSTKPLKFPFKIPQAPLGSFTLLDKNTLLASALCSSPFPHGLIHFEESQEPPSRAYLKLYEALILAEKIPEKGARCLEIGASPGGWTWVLAKLGAEVFASDRSELAPNITALPNVHFIKGNSFSLTPQTFGPVDWIFSDVACYPEKLFEWVMEWLDSGLCKNFICTLKFQGEGNYEIAKQFAKINGSRVIHLGFNKHELTWIY